MRKEFALSLFAFYKSRNFKSLFNFRFMPFTRFPLTISQIIYAHLYLFSIIRYLTKTASSLLNGQLLAPAHGGNFYLKLD
jgi:hypothetical protein